VVVTYIAFSIVSMLQPYVYLKYRMKKERRQSRFQPSFLEAQAKRDVYDGGTLMDDYVMLLSPVAFVCLFGMVRPDITVFACIALSLQIRSSGWKLLRAYQRPFPHPAKNIGHVNKVLTALLCATILNNIGLFLTQLENANSLLPEVLQHADGPTRTFFVLENLAGCAVAALAYMVPDVSSRTKLSRARQALQLRVLSQRREQLILGSQSDAECNVRIRVHGDAQAEKYDKHEHLHPHHAFYIPNFTES